MRAIVLAAGQGYKLDGFNKLLIVDPKDEKTIIDKLIDAFGAENLKVVLGFRAINVMNRYPNLNYVFNNEWNVTNNSYSLALAIDNEPCYVLSGDLIIQPEFLELLKKSDKNIVVTRNREQRTSTAINTICDTEGNVQEFYQGKLKNHDDRESMGIFKIMDTELLRQWRQNCFDKPNNFIAQNLPLNSGKKIIELISDDYKIFEIDTPIDYLNLINSQ